MRVVSRIEYPADHSNILPMPASRATVRDEHGPSAFRGLLIAASLSALFWGVCLTALWLMRTRT